MTVRPVRPAEHDALGKLCVEAYRAAGVAVATYEPRLRDVAGRARAAEVLVAENGAGLLGTVTFALDGPLRELGTPDEAEFRMLAVDPAAGGRGIGTRLVQECIDRSRAAGRARIVCSSQPGMVAAHTVYRRLGFVRDPARDWTPVPDVQLVAFVLDLNAATNAAGSRCDLCRLDLPRYAGSPHRPPARRGGPAGPHPS